MHVKTPWLRFSLLLDKVCSPLQISFKEYLQVANVSSFNGQTQGSINGIYIGSCRNTKGLLKHDEVYNKRSDEV